MKEFLGKDFLLDSPLAQKLYDEHASKMPIFDFHCHLIPEQIAHDYKFKNITECWIGANGYGDHYKWRLMREMGVDEKYITGDATDREKFQKYAECMPYFIGNPIYEWTHLELRRYFGIDKPLSPETADEIWEKANKKLETLTARRMMEMMNVKIVFTTDDPVDDLHFHEEMAKDKTLKTLVRPCMRPDKAINVERDTFLPWLADLSKVTGKEIKVLQDMLDALDERILFFKEHGCTATDHALDVLHFSPKSNSYEEANKVFLKALRHEAITLEDEDVFKGFMMLHLGREYHKHGFVQQYHIGALRNNSARNYARLGADTGYDAANDQVVVEKLSALLNALDSTDELPKTVLYSLNEKDYVSLMTLMNCFQGGGIRGKMQLGTAWWFNDEFDGMEYQMKRLADDGLISCFIGMLTDSRSFLSYPRHEYFRREMCNFIAEFVNKGRYPNDEKLLGKIVEDISYNNAYAYFLGK
jgi:glucuronate isomerase